MRELPEGLLEEMVSRLVEALNPVAIYLFGSHAYGDPDPHSDLDFLIVVDDESGDPDQLALKGRRSLLDLRVPVDLLVYPRSEMDKWSPVRCSLPHTVVHRGKLLYAA